MVKHIVLWKIKDGEDKQKNMTRMAEMLTALVGKIDGLEAVEMGYNFNAGSDYDIVLYATLRSAAALRYYQEHPLHVECKSFISQITVDRTAADYFYEEGVAITLPEGVAADDPYMASAQTEVQTFVSNVDEKIVLPEIEANNEPVASVSVEEPIPSLDKEEQPKLSFETPIATDEKIILPQIAANDDVPYHEQDSFKEEPPSLESYNINNQGNSEQDSNFSYIKNDQPMGQGFANGEFNSATQPAVDNESTLPPFESHSGEVHLNYSSPAPAVPSSPVPAPEMNTAPQFMQTPYNTASMPFGQNSMYGQPAVQPPYGQPVMQSVTFAPQPEEEPKPMRFDDLPPAAPMRFNDLPPAAPMRFEDVDKEEPTSFEQPIKTVSAPAPISQPEPVAPVQEKRSMFGKKEKNVSEVTQAINNDVVPDNYWKCPNCGKVMPKYVGTCGCGETQPFEDPQFDTQDAEKINGIVAPAPISQPEPVAPVQEKRSMFGKKEKNVSEVTQAINNDVVPDNYWKCPSCGKVMPKYVGTCGCGETQPFEDPTFDEPVAKKEAVAPVSAPVASAPISQPEPVAPVQEKRSMFGKKEKNVSEVTQVINNDVVPDNYWKCPSCGKVMPKYVGTCGCGETQPFEDPTFDKPVAKREAVAPVSAPVASAPISQPEPVAPVQEKRSMFGKKEKNVSEVTQAINNDVVPDNYWKCPSCGKVMPKYVGTCGCGETQPFEDPTFDEPVAKKEAVAPVSAPVASAPISQPEPVAPVQEKRSMFGKKEKNVSEVTQAINNDVVPDNYWKCPSCGKVMPKYVGTCGCGETQPFEDPTFDKPVAKREAVAPVSAPVASAPISQPEPVAPVQEKRSMFGKKEKNVSEVTQAINNDVVPDNYWKCPNCGKVMPKYVGTCGCGETQPFEDPIYEESDEQPLSNAWKCPKCSGLNSIFQRRCTSCGKLRPEE